MFSSQWIMVVFASLISALYISKLWRKKIDVQPSSSWNNPRLFQLEYEQLCEGIRSRDNGTIIAGTIFLTASIFLLGTSIDLLARNDGSEWTGILVLASLSIYAIWLICFNMSSGVLDNISYQRLKKMEETRIVIRDMNRKFWVKSEDMKIHRYVSEESQKIWWLKVVRRPVWLYLFWVLVFAAFFILNT